MRLLLALLLCIAAQAAPTLYTVLPTGSMKPLFDESYYLLVETRAFSTLRVGQVIVYRRRVPYLYEGRSYDLICHQVWRRSSGGSVVLCKGVANELPDNELITADMLVGVATGWVKIDDYFKPGAIVFDKAAQVGQP